MTIDKPNERDQTVGREENPGETYPSLGNQTPNTKLGFSVGFGKPKPKSTEQELAEQQAATESETTHGDCSSD